MDTVTQPSKEKSNLTSYQSLMLFMAIQTLLYIPIMIVSLIPNLRGDKLNRFLPSSIILISAAVSTLCGWVLAFMKSSDSFFFFYVLRIEKSLLMKLFIMSTTILHALIMYERTLCGKCSDDFEWYEAWSCNPYNESHAIPMDSFILSMFIPFVFFSIFEEPMFLSCAISWMITIVFTILSVFTLNFHSTAIASLVAYVVVSSYLLLTYYYFVYDLIQQRDYWRDTLEEKQRQAEENKATEMRHMVANVAHDLKTVSTTLSLLYY